MKTAPSGGWTPLANLAGLLSLLCVVQSGLIVAPWTRSTLSPDWVIWPHMSSIKNLINVVDPQKSKIFEVLGVNTRNTDLVNRQAYLDRILMFCDTDLVKVVTGVRRCGKSSLLALAREKIISENIDGRAFVSLNLESKEGRVTTEDELCL